jgi:hypothetical protein
MTVEKMAGDEMMERLFAEQRHLVLGTDVKCNVGEIVQEEAHLRKTPLRVVGVSSEQAHLEQCPVAFRLGISPPVTGRETPYRFHYSVEAAD